MTTPVRDADVEISIRPAERADLLSVVRIENASFPQPWPYDAFEQFLGEPGFLVATVVGNEVAGYAVADVETHYGRNIGHLKDVAVHPDHRRKGVGSTLIERTISVLSVNGADTVKLEVRESNESAKRLYRSLEFASLRRVSGYYEDDEDAIVMIRDLS